MEILQLLTDFYSIQREIMEKDTIYLISCVTISLVLYFYSKKSAILSLYPLVSIVMRYLAVIYSDFILFRYIESSILRFIIASYLVTYSVVYFTNLVLMVATGLALLHITDKYSEYLDIPYYNWVMFVVVGVTFYNVKKLQKLICSIVASIYSSLILLNGIEILTKHNLGMKNLELLGIGLTSAMALGSVFIQNIIHTKRTK